MHRPKLLMAELALSNCANPTGVTWSLSSSSTSVSLEHFDTLHIVESVMFEEQTWSIITFRCLTCVVSGQLQSTRAYLRGAGRDWGSDCQAA